MLISESLTRRIRRRRTNEIDFYSSFLYDKIIMYIESFVTIKTEKKKINIRRVAYNTVRRTDRRRQPSI